MEMTKSEFERRINILKLVLNNGEISKYYITWKCNISAKMITSTLDDLCIKGLIEKIKPTRKRINFKITEKGIILLNECEKLKSQLL